MNSKPQSVLIAVLALTTLGSAGLAWQQYRALTAIRTATTRTDDTSAELQRRLTEAEQRAHALENEIAGLRVQAESEPEGINDRQGPPPLADGGRPGPRDGGPRRQGFVDNFSALMENPEFVRLMNAQEKARLDGRYSSLFKDLVATGVLTPQQIETFKDLLIEKQNAARDTMLAARANGMTDRSEIRKLAQEAQAEVDRQIQTQLGAAAYDQYKSYEQNAPQRSVVNQLSQQLSYSATPLTDAQARQLVQILAETGSQSSNNRPANALVTGGGTRITDETVARAQGLLSADQLAALIAVQEGQKNQRRISEITRANRQNQNAQQSPTTYQRPATK